MTIGIIAKIKIQAGKESEAEAIFSELEEKVNKNEDGCVFYGFFKDDDGVYIALEKYKSQEALDAHGKTDYFRELGKKMGAIMGGPPEINRLKGF